MGTLFQDLRYGARMFFKSPGFTFIAVIMLALGIGANTAMFSVVNGVLLKPLPYANPEQLVRLFESSASQPRFPMAQGNFQDYRAQNTTLSGLALYTRQDVELSQGEKPERLAALGVSAGYFELLGVQPFLGREFRREDELPNSNPAVILSHALWQRRFNSDAGIIGKSVKLSGRLYAVVGVMPPGVQHVGGDYRSMPHGETVDVWGPLEMPPQAGRGSHFCNAIGRLKPGVTVAQAAADLNAIAARLEQQYPNTNEGWRIAIKPLHEEIVGQSRTMLLVLLGAVFFVLLIACVNVANLLLARAAAREGEIAIRAAVGAGRWRIIRQLLTESLLLAVISSAAGILLAQWAIDALGTLGPDQLPRLQAVTIDGRILLFTLGLTMLTALLFGLAPAIQAGKINLNEMIKEGSRGTAGMRQRRLRDGLVVLEVALALVLLAGAGLLIRSFWKLQQVDAGFQPARVLTASLSLPRARYEDAAKTVTFEQQLLDRIAALPGVESAGLTSDLPWTGYDENAGFMIEGKTFPPNDGPGGRYHFVSADYFRTVGVPLLAGRFFNANDDLKSPNVVLINQAMASLYWPGEDATGKRFTFNTQPKDKDWYTIVGVVGDVKDFPDSVAAVPAFYWPTSQQAPRDLILAVRTRGEPMQLLERMRNEVRLLDPDLPLAEAMPLAAIASRATARQRFTLWLVGCFAGTALLLAAIGIYSVVSYLVTQRTNEFGIRMALGAQGGDVLKLILGQGMRLVGTGILIGLVAAVAATRLMTGMLYQVSATDPVILSIIALLLFVIALLACLLPARRASRLDPLVGLRCD